MAHTEDTRLDTLELRYTDLDDQVDAINKTLYRQQQLIDRLLQRLAQLEAQLAEAAQGPRGALDERPPHY